MGSSPSSSIPLDETAVSEKSFFLVVVFFPFS